jgi:hypothetical protein
VLVRRGCWRDALLEILGGGGGGGGTLERAAAHPPMLAFVQALVGHRAR